MPAANSKTTSVRVRVICFVGKDFKIEEPTAAVCSAQAGILSECVRWKQSLALQATAPDDSVLEQAVEAEAKVKQFRERALSREEDGSAFKAWLEEEVPAAILTKMTASMAAARDERMQTALKDLLESITTCKGLSKGKPNGGDWHSDIPEENADMRVIMDAAQHHILQEEFASKLKMAITRLNQDQSF
eukprot:6467234-Amphidinium_carterae.2